MNKRFLLYLLPVAFILLSSFLSASHEKSKSEKRKAEKVEKIINTYKPAFEALDYNVEAFLKLTPKKYKELTGQKLSIKQALELRQMQKAMDNMMDSPADDGAMPQWAYILLVILGLGFIPIGVMSDWTGNDWWLNILLTLCFWIPGVIHGLIVMKKYY